MKTVCIYHPVDLDGWMSAAIVKKYLIKTANNGDGQSFLGYNYGDAIPDLSEYDKVIMCDISFPKEDMLNINQKLGENFIWIDHHQRTIDDINQYIITNGIPMEGSVTETGELRAACELTWEYFFPNKEMPEIVRLLGRYDCFGHKGTDEEQKVLTFQYGARQAIGNYSEAYEVISMPREHQDTFEFNTLEKGDAIYKYLCMDAKQAYKNGFEIELMEQSVGNAQYDTTTKNFLCINKERFNPINFGIDYHKDGYDGCACFHYANGMYNFSIYNDNGLVDCSIIAKQYGGGGHKGASGFRLTQEQFNELIE